jgi:alkaline phosphatase D
LLTAACALALSACALRPGAEREALRIDLGPMAGEVTAESAILWARATGPGRLEAEIAGGGERWRESAPLLSDEDFTARIPLRELKPGTRYVYQLRALGRDDDEDYASSAVLGHFRTAPADADPAPVRMAFGGDLAGQNVCRHREEGFPIFRAVLEQAPDLFLGLGDMIYADGVCLETGLYGNPQVPGDFPPSSRLQDFWAHWRYSRRDPAFRKLLAETPYLAVWDDHEVVNDFGPHDQTREQPPYTPGQPLMPLGLAALVDYNPLPGDGDGRLYRRIRWGRHLELFLLDTRQYRDPAGEPDTPQRSKSLLGAEQRAWLEEALTGSDATWKVVVTSVPLSIPTGHVTRRDGWADGGRDTGYEEELLGILRALRDGGVRRTLWLTTDVHHAAHFRYRPFPDTPDFEVDELVTGPLNAGLFRGDRFDKTLHGERLFIYGPEDFRNVSGWEEARGFFNFGVLDIDAAGALTLRVIGVDGRSVYEAELGAPG